MHFAYFFVLFFVDPSLQNEKMKKKNPPQYCTLELFMTPPPIKTNKQTKHKQKIGERKTNTDLAKMVSDCTIYIHIFSKKYIYRRERPSDSHLQEGARSSL